MNIVNSIKKRKILIAILTVAGVIFGMTKVVAETAPSTAVYRIEGGAAARAYFDDNSFFNNPRFECSREFDLWKYTINNAIAYCVNYGAFAYYGSNSGGDYNMRHIGNLNAEGTAVLVYGYGGPKNSFAGLGYGYLDGDDQRYATQAAVYLVSGQNKWPFEPNDTRYFKVRNNTNGRAVIGAANALADHARRNPISSNDSSGNSSVALSGGGEDITKKTKIIDNGANAVVGPFVITTQNCGSNTIEASITNSAPASFCDSNGVARSSTYNNGDSIYFKISTSYTGTSVNIKVKTTAQSGYNAAIYRMSDKWDNEMQDFAKLYDATSYPDKTISVPLENLPRRELYVRHVNNKTQEVIPCSNSEKELINGNANDFVVRNNLGSRTLQYSSAGKKTPITYQEYYRYGSKNLMQVSRSLVYSQTLPDGRIRRYVYTGGAKSVGSTFQEAYTNFVRPTDDVWTSKSLTVNTGALYKNAADVTLMEFYYNVYTEGEGGEITPDPNISVDPDPKVGNGFQDSSTTDKCNTTYTPSGKNIKPYLITSKYYAKDIRYELQADGKYHLTDFKVNMLQSGEAINSNKTNEITGSIIGNDYTTLFNGTTNQIGLKISSNLIEELQKLKNKLSTMTYPVEDLKDIETNLGASDGISKAIKSKTIFYPNPDAPEQITHRNITDRIKTKSQGETQTGGYGEALTKAIDFDSWRLVPKEKYNGLRMVHGIANYTTCDVLASNTYGNTKIETTNKEYVNVYTPVTVGEVHVKSEGIVDQTVGNKGSDTIQRNAPFTVTIAKTPNSTIYGKPTREYISHYNVIFGMDVVYKGNTVKKGIPIRIDAINADGSAEIKDFKATDADTTGTGNEFIQSISNKITVIGVAYNVPDRLNTPDALEAEVLSQEARYLTIEGVYKYINGKTGMGCNWPNEFGSVYDTCPVNLAVASNRKQSHATFGGNSSKYGSTFKTMIYDAYYFARNQTFTSNIGRLYDFQITDCSDVNFKNVFRKGTTTGVNDLTNVIYFSGTKELKIYSTGVNDIKSRGDAVNIPGTATQTIFPLGPYKHTQANYLQAPKLGYRISFNVKTTGYYKPSTSANDPKRKVIIKPTYYYVSKDGSKMTDQITLYYKASDGKYKNFSNSNYKISFKPNDGYRNLYNSPRSANDVTDFLSPQLQELNLANSSSVYDGEANTSGWFTLDDTMVTLGNNNYIQAWYGEFKLPNSTIAVEKGKSINNPLTNGYIGVRFEVRCVDTTTETNKKGNTISYNQNDKNASGMNTTQWDYEGFMGFNTPGTELKTANNNNLRFQLENGVLQINDQSRYNIVKSTAVLFDIDNRAADDFQ